MKHDPDDLHGYQEKLDEAERADAAAEEREVALRQLGARVVEILREHADEVKASKSAAEVQVRVYSVPNKLRDAARSLGLLGEEAKP